MELLNSFPLLLVDDELDDTTAAGRATRTLVEHLRSDGIPVITATDLADAQQIIDSTATLSGLLIDWDGHHISTGADADTRPRALQTETMIDALRARSPLVPIFVLADRSAVDAVPVDVLGKVTGYVWKLEDTASFVTSRVAEARREYLAPLLPPFFDALVRFTQEARYSWHTPGHSGGTAFLKSAIGSAFHEFFGENTLRSDLSVSVAELGSLMEHSGPVGEAEAAAARTFGADRTMFVTNGTSTANKIVFHSTVRRGDVVLVDRNCHKSIMHAIVMTGAIPVYLHPSRNAYGIIGPIPPRELTAQHIQKSLATNPLVPEGTTTARLAVITNCTYDGLCYDAPAVLDAVGESSQRVLFDEAWFAYAHFHPLYARRHAMGIERRPGQPATFATQSTHKLLTAFSQASMVHLHDSDGVIDPTALEEAFMMHTSTSPQYGIIASLDVASKMMDGPQGTALIDDAVEQALAFRRELATSAADRDPDDWTFDVWQPAAAASGTPLQQRDPDHWVLRDGENWHGYRQVGDGHAMLDPIKVTILTPGISPHGDLQQRGIPAALVTRFLDERGIVVEKTGAYCFLVLFSLGITRGKAGTLLAELFEFKRLYDQDAPLTETLPRLVDEHPGRYGTLTLRTLADAMQAETRDSAFTELTEGMYADLPEPVTTPAAAHEQLITGTTEMVEVDKLGGRVSAAMVVPYPPGIPVIMPGERFPTADGALLRYLTASQAHDIRFPGFATEIHGVHIQPDGAYRIPCLPAER
ncbi:MAG: arginine decarboxylase [Pseudonocardiales bacterium]|nr:arginine decarboxylase [Pseudonocardiales bacterium]